MDYSYQNTELWNFVIQFGIIALAIVVSNILRQKVAFVRKSLLPTAVIAGFLLLLLRTTGILTLDMNMLETITYHGIAVGFIAMSLRVGKSSKAGRLIGAKTGALIASTYVIQGIFGLIISLGLAYTFMPSMFKAAGILLPMGYGQGPGQANNVGGTYEALGFAGGRSFGLSIAAAGYLCACVVGIIYLNILARKGKIPKRFTDTVSGSVTVDDLGSENEMPVSESLDRFSMQVALVLVVYLFTYAVSYGITWLVQSFFPGLANTVVSLVWGFNFILGSVFAIILRTVLAGLRKKNIMKRQYQNDYLLSRISGLAFDIMIVGGIASIDISNLKGLWIPFLLMAVVGGVITLVYLQLICKKLYPEYYYEAMLSMFGMMTGTISSGVLLLREVDPDFKTPASNNLIVGSSFAIVFGAPVLLLVSIAPNAPLMTLLTLGLCFVYFGLLLLFLLGFKRKKA